MPGGDITWEIIKPISQLSDFVESFWMLANQSETAHDIVVLPDGRFDIFFSYAANQPYHVTLMGLGSEPDETTIAPKTVMFAISFKLLAIEFMLDIKLASIVNNAHTLPAGFWEITINDLNDFKAFCDKATAKMLTLINPDIDSRKQKLFDLIYSSNGSCPVKELPLKKFTGAAGKSIAIFNPAVRHFFKSILQHLQFRASLPQIKNGRLFPEENFADQTHFIKQIKRFSGVVPKELLKNKNDRFILLSTLPAK